MATFTGTDGDDTYAGTDQHDEISGGSGDDLLSGAADIDSIDGGTGDDSLYGGSGHDALTGGEGRDFLYGGSGDDLTYGGVGNDVIDGGSGFDTVSYARAANGVTVTIGGYPLGGPGAAGDGTDVFHDVESAVGSNFNDDIHGSSGDDVLRGLDGDDRIIGWGGTDIFDGGRGSDDIWGGSSDTVTYRYASGAVTVQLQIDWRGGFSTSSEGNDMLHETGNVVGSRFADVLLGNKLANTFWGLGANDTIRGAQGSDILRGGAGDDVLDGGVGADVMNGGTGVDTARWRSATAAVGIDRTTAEHTGAAEGDYMFFIERFLLTNFADTFQGNADAEEIYGYAGADTLRGGDGDDLLSGGGGMDTLTGGEGVDRFQFVSWPESDGDRVTDLEDEDVVDLAVVDADTTTAGNQAFVRVEGDGAFTAAGQLRLTQHGADTWLELNTDGDAEADAVILLTGNHTAATAEDGWML